MPTPPHLLAYIDPLNQPLLLSNDTRLGSLKVDAVVPA